MVCAMEIPHKNTHISKLVMNYKDIQVKKDFEEEFKDVFTCAKHVRENFIDITLKGVTKEMRSQN